MFGGLLSFTCGSILGFTSSALSCPGKKKNTKEKPEKFLHLALNCGHSAYGLSENIHSRALTAMLRPLSTILSQIIPLSAYSVFSLGSHENAHQLGKCFSASVLCIPGPELVKHEQHSNLVSKWGDWCLCGYCEIHLQHSQIKSSWRG